jgi:hypothetical protein
MSRNYHTPLAFNSLITSVSLNAIFSALDTGISGVNTRVGVLETQAAGTAATSITLGASTELTIASGAVTLSGSKYHTLDTEGDAATDYLDTINGNAGDIFELQLENAARLVTIRHLATNGNIILSPSINFAYTGVTQIVRGFHDGTYAYLFAPTYQSEAIAYIEDQKAQNTDGGAFTSGAWRTRDLNTKVADANVICSITKLPFTSGGTAEIVAGDEIEGATSGETATVFDVELTGGSWAGGDAAGNLWLNDQSGAFVAENLDTTTQANIATIAADSTNNEVRLLAGTYRMLGNAGGHYVNFHQTRIQNTTDAETIGTGTCERSNTGAGQAFDTRSFVAGRVTVAVSTTFELQHRCSTTRAADGFGKACNLTTEVYAQLQVIKEL